MSQQSNGQRPVNLQGVFKPRQGASLQGRARRLAAGRISFWSSDRPLGKVAGQLLILVPPTSSSTRHEVVEAECVAEEVIHAADAMRIELKVLRWGDNSSRLLDKYGLRS